TRTTTHRTSFTAGKKHDRIAGHYNSHPVTDAKDGGVGRRQLDPHGRAGADIDLVEIVSAFEHAEGHRPRNAGAAGHGGIDDRQRFRPEHEHAAAALPKGADARHRHAVARL